MELSIATNLISSAVPPKTGQLWNDLGAGSGLFTRALAELLTDGRIIAIDRDMSAMKAIPASIRSTQIEKIAADFRDANALPEKASGILMANSLHFVEDKLSFLAALRSKLLPDGQLIIIEYEMTKPNAWVPFPIDFDSLSTLAARAGFSEVRKVATTASRFQNNGIYSAAMTNPGNL